MMRAPVKMVSAFLAVLCVASLAGCSHSAPVARKPMVRVGVCYARLSGPPVSCAQQHLAQTVFLGRGSVADGAAAMAPCRQAQARFLGQDFHTRLDLRLWVAKDKSWYRCDVVIRNSTRATTDLQEITGSLRGIFRHGVAESLQACLAAPYHPRQNQPYVSCAHPHVAQELFVAPAIGTLNEPYPTDVASRAASACHATASAAKMLGKGRTVTAFYPSSARAWDSGDRTADCWVTATSGTLPRTSTPSR
jgi:Septum formation